jgi:hypothetical protein
LDTPSESFSQPHAGGTTVASSDVALPVGGIMMELQPCCTTLLVKTLSSSQTRDNDAIGIMPSLEASLKTLLGLGCHGDFTHIWLLYWVVDVEGVGCLTPEEAAFLLVDMVVSLFLFDYLQWDNIDGRHL